MLEAAFTWGPDAPLVRYLESLRASVPWLLGAALFVVALALHARFAKPSFLTQRLVPHASWLVALVGIVLAARLSWVADDAFISFRYARNWAQGLGLVYNTGERVEGYTNFLWTALMAVGVLFHVDPGPLSFVLSLASFAGVIWLCTRLLLRLSPTSSWPPLSLAGLALAGNYTFGSFATSGMETMAATLLVLLAVERAQARAPLAAGAAGVAAILMHPDHALFYAGLGLALALPRSDLRRTALRYGAPFALVFVPYYLARWHYYGDFYPNTYYAKSGGQAYFTQGVVYLWVSGLSAGAVLVAPFALYGAVRLRHTVFGRFVLIALPLYLAYVAKIGGDFMLGRLLCPLLPPWFLAAELGARELFTRSRGRLPAYLGIFLLALAVVPPRVVKANEKYLNIADERTFYPLKTFSPFVVDCAYTEEAKALRTAFAHAPRPPRLGIGCIGIVGFETDYPVMDNWGLTNRGVAHMEIRGRGRPGHEKLATPGFAFDGNADFSDVGVWPPPYDRWSKVRLRDFEFSLVKYDEALLKTVRRTARVSLPDIDRLVRELPRSADDPSRVACDAWFFQKLYFSQQDNERLRAILGDKLVAADARLASLQNLLLFETEAPPPGWSARTLFSFDTLVGFVREGDAFTDDPSSQDLRGQGHVFGQQGRFVSSLTARALDAARGRLLSPAFTLEGDVIVLRVAGGRQPLTETVNLLVDGAVVATATGCDSEVFGRRVWSTAALRGKQARLEIKDDADGGWGHVLVDEVSEWRRVD